MADDIIVFSILKQIKDNTDHFLEDSKENVKNIQALKEQIDEMYSCFENINTQVIENRKLFDCEKNENKNILIKLQKEVNGVVCEMKSHLKYQHNSKGVT